MFDNNLLAMHKAKEKTIHDTWVTGCGIEIKVTPVKIQNQDGSTIMHDADPFGIEASYVGYDDGVIQEYEEPENRYAIFTNEEYQFTSISNEIMADEQLGESDIQNHNLVYGYIAGEIVPKGSIIEFAMFGSVKMRVNNIKKKRPQSDVFMYELGRQ